MRALFALILATTFSCLGGGAQELPPSDAARGAVATIGQLRAIGVPNPDSEDFYTPPSKVPPLLRQLNDYLGQIILYVLNNPKRYEIPPVEPAVISELERAGWKAIPPDKWAAYGEIIHIVEDESVPLDANFKAVSTRLWVPCAGDQSSYLYVFRQQEGRWKLALKADFDFTSLTNSEDDGSEYGARFALSPPDPQGRWFVVSARTNVDCNWEPTHVVLSAIVPGPEPDKPKVMVEVRQSFYRGIGPFKPPFAIHAERDWFSMVVGVLRKLDGNRGIQIYRYGVNGSEARRIAPIAFYPADFLDEWVAMPWKEVERWTDASKKDELRDWHEKLRAVPELSSEVESVQPCEKEEGAINTWLLELSVMNPLHPPQYLFISVSRNAGTFFVDRISTVRPPGCPGRTRPVEPSEDLPVF